jgi:hypothetical protein
MKTLLLKCDYMGYKPSLYVEGDTIYRSKFTGCLSILIAILSLVSAGYFGSELIVKSTPIVIEASSNFEDFGPYPVSNKGLFVMLGMEIQDGTYYSDPTIFEVHAENVIIENIKDDTGKINQVYSFKKLGIDICSKYYNQSDILEKNIILPLDLVYCLKPNETTIQGYWGSPGSYSSVQVKFTKCVNKTENNYHCKPQEVIDKTIQSGFISVDYTMFEPNHKNVTHPLERVFFDNYNLLNANASLQYAIDLRTQQFKSDDGLVFPEVNTYEGFTHDLKIFNILTRDENIFSITFQGSHVGKIYLRSYIKLQTVITQIGGFVKFIMLSGSLISTIFSKNLFYIHYLYENNIFSLKKEKDKIMSQKSFQDSQKLSSNNKLISIDASDKSNIGVNKSKLKTKVPQNNNNNLREDRESKLDNTNAPLEKNKDTNYIKEISHFEMKNNNKPEINFRSNEIFKSNGLYKNNRTIQCNVNSNHDQQLYKVLFKYLSGMICPCRSLNRSDDTFVVYAMEKLFKKTISMDIIVKKFFEVELMKKLTLQDKKILGNNFSLSVYNTIMKFEKNEDLSNNIFNL